MCFLKCHLVLHNIYNALVELSIESGLELLPLFLDGRKSGHDLLSVVEVCRVLYEDVALVHEGTVSAMRLYHDAVVGSRCLLKTEVGSFLKLVLYLLYISSLEVLSLVFLLFQLHQTVLNHSSYVYTVQRPRRGIYFQKISKLLKGLNSRLI
jgi:hypothetical protein